MPLQIVKPSDLRFNRSLFFGPSGHGKTTLLGSAQLDPRTSPMLLLDFEGGVESLAGLDIDVVRIRDWKDYNDAFEYLEKGKHEYLSCGIDSISETHIFALLGILAEESAKGRKGHADQIQQGDYGIALVQMRRLIREFRDLPMHVFFTSLATEELDAREGMVKKPALAGAFRDEGPGLMSAVGYLALTADEKGETIRTLLLQNAPRVRTKVRMGWEASAPDYIDNPSIGKLLDVMGYEPIQGYAINQSTPERVAEPTDAPSTEG